MTIAVVWMVLLIFATLAFGWYQDKHIRKSFAAVDARGTRLEQYQWQVASGSICKPGINLLSHTVHGLCGESGEIADLVKKSDYMGRELDEAHLEEEAGDLLWYLTALCNLRGLSLEDLAMKNHAKLIKRHPTIYREIL